jgi:hypothetical protein
MEEKSREFVEQGSEPLRSVSVDGDKQSKTVNSFTELKRRNAYKLGVRLTTRGDFAVRPAAAIRYTTLSNTKRKWCSGTISKSTPRSSSAAIAAGSVTKIFRQFSGVLKL